MAWIEGELDAASASDVEARLSADPELHAWARATRADRLALAVLARRDAALAPRGLWRDALGEAERRALLAEEAVTGRAASAPVVFRITPARLVAAAALLIVASLGAIAPFLTGGASPGQPGPAALAPGADRGAAAGDDRDVDVASAESERPAPPAPSARPGDGASAAEQLAQAAAPDRREPDETTRAFAFNSAELAAGPPRTPSVRTLLASHHAADPNGIVAGRAVAGPLMSGYRNLSASLEPRRRPMPGAFPDAWGMTLSDAQRLASEHRLAIAVAADDPGDYLEELLAALGRRAVVVSPGAPSDRNGVSAPVELLVSAPVEKTERALRVCAIGARSVRLGALPPRSRPGDWASEALWWTASDRRDGLIRVFIAPR